LWFIGVLPDGQGLGLGAKLSCIVLEKCDEDRRPVFLQNSAIKNIPWYERSGFEVFNELDIGYNLFQMIRRYLDQLMLGSRIPRNIRAMTAKLKIKKNSSRELVWFFARTAFLR